MKWQKLGRVYVPNGQYDWAQTHAYLPTPLILDDKRIRIYLAFWDKEKVGRIGFVDLDQNNPLRVLEVSKQPVLDIGEPGTFDDNGVSPSSVIANKEKKFLYYFGWQKGVKVRYFLFSGLAISDKEGKLFKRFSKAPILDRQDEELFIRSAPFVMFDQGIYKMWYVSGNKWIEVKGKKVPSYQIRYTESNDGFSWNKETKVCLELSGNDEFGLGRPYLIKEDKLYKMWYSIRTVSKGYRIGYAESTDGLNWLRKDDEVGIDVSEKDWDSEMVCFPSIIDFKGKRYLFYNGNNYGQTGFGVAQLKQ